MSKRSNRELEEEVAALQKRLKTFEEKEKIAAESKSNLNPKPTPTSTSKKGLVEPKTLENYKRHLLVYEKKMQLSQDLDAKLEIMEKMDKLEEELISKRNDPAFLQAVNAATVMNMISKFEGMVAASTGHAADKDEDDSVDK